MAVDYGDDIGEMLVRAIGRSVGRSAGRAISRHAEQYFGDAIKEFYKAQYEREGLSPETADAKAEDMASREQVCLPFGTKDDAAYFTQVCRDNGIAMLALSNKSGNGYVYFAKEDIGKVKDCVPQFSEVMTELKNREISEQLENARPMTEKQLAELEKVETLPDLSSPISSSPSRNVTLIPVAFHYKDSNEIQTHLFAEQDTEGLDIDQDVFFSGYTHEQLERMVGKDVGEDFIVMSVGQPYQMRATALVHEAPGKDALEHSEHVRDDRAGGEYNHTERIRDEVLSAREQCRDLGDFERILNEKGIGIDTTKDGEMLFYEARIGEDGKLLPYDHAQRDWAVGANTLKAKFDVDATHDWFEKHFDREQAEVADGSLDMDGATPDINQGIDSHDGMDTDNRTLRLEREQNGTDVSPSMVREEAARTHDDGRGYDLSSTAKECRKASSQLSKSNDAPDRDISDKFQQER